MAEGKLAVLIILDGFGISKTENGNAIHNANTPNLNRLMEQYPNTLIHASGLDVGLPNGQMGNSEVGHLNIGAGRIVYQELTRITKDIEEGTFFDKEEFLWAVENVKRHGSSLHLMGLLSDGGVHSHLTHIFALLELAKKHNLKKVYIHCFLDGRDVPPASAKEYVQALEAKMRDLSTGKIATIMGRYYAMDRDNRWERVEKAYRAMVLGEGDTAACAFDAIDNSYNKNITDEFMIPTVIMEDGQPVGKVQENDSIIFFNFRPDRAREITRTFVEKNFDKFKRPKGYFPVSYVSMTQYDATFTDLEVAYKPQVLDNTLGQYLSSKNLRQLRIAETEKYAHVTFFFNGGVELPNEGEDRVLIPSPKVPTYDLKPEMSAYEVTEEVIKRIKSGEYDVIVLNYANPDMVGHTGVFDAAVKAIETVDECIGRVVNAVLEAGGKAIITADHGNSEQMVDYSNESTYTAHTTNTVPFILVDKTNIGVKLRQDGRLADIAPTFLEIMGLTKPQEMTGESLIIK
ncbi:MAG: 2,3-bisphosphoglycerate-independent phosphoglycerate mutase [Mahellales bacterium]|jgi:2,3-bisphosphoglycerate-independent phosphoglycerate mutase